MEIWDIPGYEKNKGMWRLDLKIQRWGYGHFFDVDCCVLMCDLTNKKSFDNLDYWMEKFVTLNKPDKPDVYPFILVATKADNFQKRQVLKNDLNNWAFKNNMYDYYEVSAKTNFDMDFAWEGIAKACVGIY